MKFKKLHRKHIPLLNSFFMSILMAFVMSGIVTWLNRGITLEFITHWLNAYARAWPIAFFTILLIRPAVGKLVGALVVAESAQN